MKIEIKVPAMGESISEATIGTILKTNGTNVNADEEILELETDKVNQALYAPQNGILQLAVKAGETVKIGQVIGSVEGDASASSTQQQPAQSKKEETPQAPPTPTPTTTKSTSTSPIPASKPSPVPEEKEAHQSAKEILEEARLTRDAFLADLKEGEQSSSTPFYQPSVMIPAPEKASKPETRKKMSKIRRLIANRMVEAQHITAMLTTFNEVDMSEVINLREKYKDSFQKKHGAKLGFMSFFVKACIGALKAIPEVNASIEGEDIVYKNYYDIGIAVGTERGVIVPVVRGADALSFAQIESKLEQFASKSREGSISADDLQGGTFTITNGGVYGSLLSTPIINPPQSAILGMHKINKRPVVINDEIVIRPMMYLALTYDHRIIDGQQAVTFLVQVKNLLEDPSRLFLEV